VLLFRFASLLLARPLAGECLLRTALVAGLEIERVLLDVLDDVFLLDLPLEAAKRAFDRLAFLDFDFGQSNYTPSPTNLHGRQGLRRPRPDRPKPVIAGHCKALNHRPNMLG
jgi:hypothetical protein